MFAEEEAALLVAEARGDDDQLEQMTAARIAGEPLEYVLGWAEFRGIRISVERGVFVPRRRTGFLVEEAVAEMRHRETVVDLCCGSGAIGAAIIALRPDAELYAADIDPVAVRCARANLGADRVVGGDLFDPLPVGLRGRIGTVVVNAPYVPTDEIRMMPAEARDHEALTALDGGPDGLEFHRRIAAEARDWLAPGGRLLIETSRLQAAGTAGILSVEGMSVSIRRSLPLDATVVVATSPVATSPVDGRRPLRSGR